MAPLFIKEYYIPSFIKEYLRNNPEEQFLIVIIHSNFEYGGGVFDNLNINDINQFISEEKLLPYSQRLNIIHIQTNFDLNVKDQNIQDFCGSIYRPGKLNILYFGFSVCGNNPNVINPLPPNYLLIGCGFYKYNQRIERFGYIQNFIYDQENIENVFQHIDQKYEELLQKFRLDNSSEEVKQYGQNQSQCKHIAAKRNRMIDMPEQCKITLDMVNRIINPPVNI
jgi:hypothetical protein